MIKKYLFPVCLFTIFIFVQCNRKPLTTNPLTTNLSDYKSNDGKVSLQISGGKAPYKIVWTDGNADSVRTKLKAGIYYVTITDAKKQKVIDTIEIKQPPYPVCKDKDGNVYITAIIGNTVWMIENLRSTKTSDGIELTSINPTEDAKQYGLLYDWKTAMNGQIESGSQGICPDGWHIPTNDEWTELTDYIETNELEINQVFNLQYGGFYNNGVNNVGESASYWSSTQTQDNVWKRYFNKNLTKTFKYHENRNNAISVRCVRNKEFADN